MSRRTRLEYEPEYNTEVPEEESIVMAVHETLACLIKYGQTEETRLRACDLAIQFIDVLDLLDEDPLYK